MTDQRPMLKGQWCFCIGVALVLICGLPCLACWLLFNYEDMRFRVEVWQQTDDLEAAQHQFESLLEAFPAYPYDTLLYRDVQRPYIRRLTLLRGGAYIRGYEVRVYGTQERFSDIEERFYQTAQFDWAIDTDADCFRRKDDAAEVFLQRGADLTNTAAKSIIDAVGANYRTVYAVVLLFPPNYGCLTD